MKLRVTVLPLLVFGVFGYLIYQVDKTVIDGEIQPKAVIEEVKEDYHEVEAAFAKGGSANHGRYNK